MDVDRPARPSLADVGRHDAHVAGEHDELGAGPRPRRPRRRRSCTNGTSHRAASAAEVGVVRHDDPNVDRQRAGIGPGQQVGGAVRRLRHEQRRRDRSPAGWGRTRVRARSSPADDGRRRQGLDGVDAVDRLDLDPLVEPAELEVAVDVDDVQPGAGHRPGDGGDQPGPIGARRQEDGAGARPPCADRGRAKAPALLTSRSPHGRRGSHARFVRPHHEPLLELLRSLGTAGAVTNAGALVLGAAPGRLGRGRAGALAPVRPRPPRRPRPTTATSPRPLAWGHGREGRTLRGGVGRSPHPRPVRGPAPQGHRAAPSPASTRTTRPPACTRAAAAAPPLFASDTKFESGSGWPSFWEPAIAEAVETHEDRSLRHAPHRGHVRRLRRPPRPRVPRRSQPDRPALLHQLAVARLRTRARRRGRA